MSTLVVCLLALSTLLIAYFVYGRWLSNKLFELSAEAPVPSKELEDGQDFTDAEERHLWSSLHEYCRHGADCRSSDCRFLGLVAGDAVGGVRGNSDRWRA